jgi:hypothetical protein
VRYEPPIIGIHYKQKPSDAKKKVYTILLQKLVLHPDPEEAARQLYHEHPHILREDKIPLHKIAALIAKIQEELQIGDEDEDYYGEEYEESGEHMEYKPAPPIPPKEQPAPPKIRAKPKFMDNEFDDDNGPLNRSM